MSLLTALMVVLAAGVIAWVIEKYAPMTPGWKRLFHIVLGIAVIVCLLEAAGVFTALGRVSFPRVR